MNNTEFLYDLKFPRSPQTVRIGEMDVSLPKRPENKFIVNYGVPKLKQKFKLRPVPKDIRYWSQNDRDPWVANEYHIRHNGYWIFIKGKAIYITGAADLFFNRWEIEKGGLPDFRMEAVEWWLFWWMCERDPDCFGMFDIKCRRLGDTEKGLCAVWERSTRWFKSDGGLIHIDEVGAKENFARLAVANNKMPFFLRPIQEGSTKSKSGRMEFDVPADRITLKKLKEQDEKEGYWDEVQTGLESKIYTRPGSTGAFDGVRLRTYYADENFKVKTHKLDPKKQLGVVKPCISLNNNEKIIGKILMTSTVEEMEEGETVEMAGKLWDESNPHDRDSDNRTVSGLYRLFRGFQSAAEIDEWGFHKVKEATVKRQKKLDDLRARGKYDDILTIYRKHPADIEEALAPPLGECILRPELCEERIKQLNKGVDRWGNTQEQLGQYGNLVCKGKLFEAEIKWIPDPNGRWYISRHPQFPNKVMRVQDSHYPGAHNLYRMGCDPYDSDQVQGKGSDGAFTVKMRFNELLEKKTLKRDEHGEIINLEDLTTGGIVCDYKYRQKNPYDFYRDVMMTCIYYGVPVFPETDKPGVRTWMMNQGYWFYLQDKPGELRNTVTGRYNTVEKGAKASASLVSQYIELLQIYIPQYIWSCNHPRVINDWKKFTAKTRTKRDLSVASGFMELADIDNRIYAKEEQQEWEDFGPRFYDN